MKMLESFGKRISKDDQRKIKGGIVEPTFCSEGETCRYYESGTGYVNGTCEKNSNNSCVCRAENSSVVWSACING